MHARGAARLAAERARGRGACGERGPPEVGGVAAHLLDDPAAQHKTAAYSQYPRCWPANVTHDASAFVNMARCSGVDKHLFAYMGFSIRTADFRYTEWAAWDGAALAPLWNVSAGVELYDHTADPPESAKDSFERFENLNVAAAQPA